MKFLVIGSNSFSGSHFINELLSKNHNVLAVSRSKNVRSVFLPYNWGNRKKDSSNLVRGVFKFEQINLNTDLKKLIQLIEEFKPEYIVNFASQGMVAESWLNPNHWFTTNLLSQVAFHEHVSPQVLK